MGASPFLECALLRRRLGDHRLPRLPRHQPRRESFLESTGTGTSFVDSTAQNGTTYYYKVFAENEHGEGPLSNEAQATPSDLVAPVQPLFTLDDFNRPDELPVSGAGRVPSASTRLRRGLPQGRVQPAREQQDHDLHRLALEHAVRARHRGVDEDRGRARGGQPHPPEGPPAAGRRHGLRRLHAAHEPTRAGRGRPRAHRQRGLRKTTDAQPRAHRWRYSPSPRQRLHHRGLAQRRCLLVADRHDERLDVRQPGLCRHRPCRPDRPPRRLRGSRRQLDTSRRADTSALAGDASATLSWTAPIIDGGSALTGYRIYRGTSPGNESFLQSVGTTTTFVDSGLTNGLAYYYKVSAENAVGEGPLSSGTQATPTGSRLRRRWSCSTTSTARTRTRSPTACSGRTR